MKRLDQETYKLIAAHVAEECGRRGISGVFAAVDLIDVYSMHVIHWTMIQRTSMLRIDVPDKIDANLFCVAMGKIGTVIAHGKNTGDRTTIFGEISFLGGRLSANEDFAYAFSGAAQEVDDEITQFAEAFHKSLE